MRREFASGVTLVELLVVMGIILALTGITATVYMSALQHARETPDIANMRQLYTGLMLYREDAGKDAIAVSECLQYVRSQAVFRSKVDRDKRPDGSSFPARLYVLNSPERVDFRISYAYVRSFPSFDRDEEQWRKIVEDSSVGILASAWHGKQLHQQLLVDGETGYSIEGPILRVNMDGSFFRLGKRRNSMAAASTSDLFFNR